MDIRVLSLVHHAYSLSYHFLSAAPKKLNSILVNLARQTQSGRAILLGTALGSHSAMPSCESWGSEGEEKPGGKVLMHFYDLGTLIFACKSNKRDLMIRNKK